VLYFDDLLVGTGTGLYGHKGLGANSGLDLKAKTVINIFPNPSNGKFYLNIPIGITIENISVYDALGRKAKSINSDKLSKKDNLIYLNISDLPNGEYHLNIRSNEKEISKKILISN